ncbi:hypothetical protein L1987_63949 [Smallanthus sonchifolius]|uniref:Uncharacterized protein n=1 Tax=Smallanthus sonchifolius TaxID=185202 RepID=A0ACB9CEP5_9ASTR|nr:hypothetical protein L1987_63949 [Smallanthus sonchifolius]
MENMVQLTNMFNYDNEIGTSQKPPKLLNLADYFNWKDRFDQLVSFTDTSLWIPILEGYTHPTYSWMGKDDVPKPVSALTTEEKLLFDREKKAMTSISMSLPKEIYHSFKQFKSSQQLWEALQKRCEGSLDVKKSRKELLKKQFLVFKHFQNESLDDLATRFYHLLSELSSASVVYETEEINDKFLEALPSKFDVVPLHSGYSSHSGFSATTTSSSSGTHNMDQKIDPVDLEEMNIQWNMAMLMRQAKDFLKKTGRKYIGSNSRSRMGFDKTKVRCYNFQEYGHFAKECVKPKVEFDSQKKPNNFQHNHNQSHGSSNFVGTISQAFVAEIHSEKSEESTDDDSSSDGFAEYDIVLTQNASDGADSESIPIAKVFMADMSDPSKLKDYVCHIYCSNCITVKDKLQKVMDDNTNLICDMKSMHSVNQKLKDNDKLCIDRIESLKRDLNSLGLKYKEQAYHLDMAYAKIEKRNEVIAQKNKEISDKESEVIKLHRKLENFENSSVVLDYFIANADPTKRVAGIGFVPPPFNANYVVEPEIIHEEEIDPKTLLKVNPVTGEDIVTFLIFIIYFSVQCDTFQTKF